MESPAKSPIFEIKDFKQSVDKNFELEVVIGLSKKNKSLPSKYFYDKNGSELFKQITDLEEYYPTRSEFEILSSSSPRLA